MRLFFAALALCTAAALQSAPRARRRNVVAMAGLRPGASVLAVGNGPVFLLAAKTAAKAGYETTIVSARTELFEQLLWSEAREEPPDPNLKILGVTTDEDVEAFNAAVARADGLLIAFDAEQTLTDALLDVVLPDAGGASRIAYLSKHLSGKGYGLFAAASKGAANKEVWACDVNRVAMYKEFEAKLRKKLAARAAPGELTVVRCGTLKGGGPGAPEDPVPEATPTLSERLYNDISKDLVNWQLLFDCDTRGVRLTPGDTAEGPGLRAVFTATTSDEAPGDTGRVQACQALVRSLARDDAAGREFGVNTATGGAHASEGEWAAALDAALA